MKRGKVITYFVAMSIGLGLPALAQTDKGVTFQLLDQDGNGELTPSEMERMRVVRLQQMDTDGNGAISKAEMVAATQARAESRADRIFARLDADDNGEISAEEIEAQAQRGRGFRRIDADGNGTISEEEFAQAREKMRDRRRP